MNIYDSIRQLINSPIKRNGEVVGKVISIFPSLQHGFRIAPEIAVVNAARTSFLGEAGRLDKDKKLFYYLYKHDHSSPLEAAEFVIGAFLTDAQWFEMVADMRYQIKALRPYSDHLANFGFVKMDLNNAIKYYRYHSSSNDNVSYILQHIFKFAFPWTAELLNIESDVVIEDFESHVISTAKVLDKGFLDVYGLSINDDDLYEFICAIDPSYQNNYASNVSAGLYEFFKRGDLRALALWSIQIGVYAPLVTYWQWVRHRSWQFSLQSGRYMPFKDDDFYVVQENDWRIQSTSNKQASSEERLSPENQNTVLKDIDFFDKNKVLTLTQALQEHYSRSFALYNAALENHVAKEQARIFLPAFSNYYKSILKVDLLSLLRFLKLRMATEAQYEIRVYANSLYEQWADLMPLTAKYAQQFAFE